MNLFIIGNGFDIAHQLETSYINFRDYLIEEEWEFLDRFEEMYGCHLDMDRRLAERYLWKDFENNLSSFDGDNIVDSATSMELGLDGGDFYIEDTLDSYWESIYKYIYKLEDYLKLWIKSIDINCCIRTDLICKNNDDLFLSFNYTSLLEEIYEIQEEQILHIHGSVSETYEDLIIGHGNSDIINNYREQARSARNQFDEKKSSICNALAAYCESILKEVKSNIFFNSGFFQRLNEVNQVLVIGHSIGNVDLPYFKEIRERTNENTIWKIYFYDDSEESTLKDKIVSIGVRPEKITMLHTAEFFNLEQQQS
jgi:hypothetical protein